MHVINLLSFDLEKKMLLLKLPNRASLTHKNSVVNKTTKLNKNFCMIRRNRSNQKHKYY